MIFDKFKSLILNNLFMARDIQPDRHSSNGLWADYKNESSR